MLRDRFKKFNYNAYRPEEFPLRLPKVESYNPDPDSDESTATDL
jgi:hypothetical protein